MPQIKPPKPEIGVEHLNMVCTITEACRTWNRGRSTIHYAIDRGYVTARRIGHDWLITVPSLIAHYGRPVSQIKR